ncbi:hypothetical protein COMNV_01322 [Commensalibacter sp. Nvir]|uniref:sulfur carrier protein ThiS n=1 Tax=Commensalibacter sp. Nvir TaxID=3069817 RepID=UPI002D2B13FF|nr:hypothetical protein COMNV_01322 [Commensalibacter sp. Nvir]
MKIYLNGKTVETDVGTLFALFEECGIDPTCVASAVNGNFVPRREYSTFNLYEDAKIEVLSPMQGG